ncbi:sulfurtransferase TusA family protein [Gilvimarinus agarilyticus]|uniref:sulfurtransferase TusA family protein n=1 Tax=Gilvimarinus sp. 2_MG-2023 TaxID=3062666 RepID=UPI001C094247|nr:MULTISPECIES: sulfurtransferase TusA family protein [unclassified Gilvimarinus]MBU2887339.1 sulfurtransferase TusA family protein [Gilvimarinus agarilyticus]MDO6571998.1 sulfurtransferase TusA family protein [Gilvimarinus sp. 2_MG-2023]MDO6746066.1 sulfurtransferase TusA family protein [Gilvimarinus sp. 1_MG-2023]
MTYTETASSPCVDKHLDARGLRCPMPLLRAKQALNQMQVGQVLQIEATDSGSVRDFQSYVQLSPHTLLEQSEGQGVYCHIIQKGATEGAIGQEPI